MNLGAGQSDEIQNGGVCGGKEREARACFIAVASSSVCSLFSFILCFL